MERPVGHEVDEAISLLRAEMKLEAMDPKLLNDVGPLAELHHRLHLGTDIFGYRHTPEEARIILKTINFLMREITHTHAGGDYILMNNIFLAAGMGNPNVTKRIEDLFTRKVKPV